MIKGELGDSHLLGGATDTDEKAKAEPPWKLKHSVLVQRTAAPGLLDGGSANIPTQ